ncbi:hypothetical protein D915_004305 [Fasciola hepatica]|uniref:CUB domain-containing protein n=1 Tax=Fasciola hepatica TaxID=6192 RepID=A0A4E0REP2_FASHE|nr:hypothetical protein D915_004305 [Fasciola hepatica]
MDSGWQCACSLLLTITFILISASAQSSSANCGNQNITVLNGYHPFFIPQHDGPRECVYNFTSAVGTIMNFHFHFVSIGTEKGKCVKDYTTVGDTRTELPHPRYTACGNKAPTWTFFSTENRATVKLLVTSELKNVSVYAEVFADLLNRTSPECGNNFIRVGTERFAFSFPPNGTTLNKSTDCSYTVVMEK